VVAAALVVDISWYHHPHRLVFYVLLK